MVNGLNEFTDCLSGASPVRVFVGRVQVVGVLLRGPARPISRCESGLVSL